MNIKQRGARGSGPSADLGACRRASLVPSPAINETIIILPQGAGAIDNDTATLDLTSYRGR